MSKDLNLILPQPGSRGPFRSFNTCSCGHDHDQHHHDHTAEILPSQSSVAIKGGSALQISLETMQSDNKTQAVANAYGFTDLKL